MTLERQSTRAERFERLYEEHFEAIRRYAWRREPALADDVVAETFLVPGAGSRTCRSRRGRGSSAWHGT
jgi:DNA-directed RNA polymerase specialized sigma24 family protein